MLLPCIVFNRIMSQFGCPDQLSFKKESCLCDSSRVFRIRNGRLLLQCKQKKCPDVEWSSKQDIYFPDIACPRCHKPTTLFLSTTNKNPGKLFYKCHPCDFFQWWNRSMQASSSSSSSSYASSSASSDSSDSSKIALVGKVLSNVGEMLQKLSLD